jgi:hypothetical protein
MSAVTTTQVTDSIRVVGGLLPADMITRIMMGKDVSASTPADYHGVGVRSVKDAAERHGVHDHAEQFHPPDALAAQDPDDCVIAGRLKVTCATSSGHLEQVIDELTRECLRPSPDRRVPVERVLVRVADPRSRSRKLNSWMRLRCRVCVPPWPCSR